MSSCVLFTIRFFLLQFVLRFVSGSDDMIPLSEAEIKAGRLAGVYLHNVYRCMQDAPPVLLDPYFNFISQEYVEKLAREDKFEHSNIYLENLALLGTNEEVNVTNNILNAINAWYDEVEVYEIGAISHFSELVWVNVKVIGIGIAATYKYFSDIQEDRPVVVVAVTYYPGGNYKDPKIYYKNVHNPASKTKAECLGQTVK